MIFQADISRSPNSRFLNGIKVSLTVKDKDGKRPSRKLKGFENISVTKFTFKLEDGNNLAKSCQSKYQPFELLVYSSIEVSRILTFRSRIYFD
jgi:hypothetical protein